MSLTPPDPSRLPARCFSWTSFAMGSEFKIMLYHSSESYARQSCRAAFQKIHDLEAVLSRFRPDSDIGRFNATVDQQEAQTVSVDTAECLKIARRLWISSQGAFDPAIGAILAWWRHNSSASFVPAELMDRSGMQRLGANDEHTRIRPLANGLQLDLGAIGKGYALDKAAELLHDDWGVEAAMLHGGESSLMCWGTPPTGEPWPCSLRLPEGKVVQRFNLPAARLAFSGSAQCLHGNHIIDPRTGLPVEATGAAWTCALSAAEADAASTALMVMNGDEARAFLEREPEIGGLRLESFDRLTWLGNWTWM